MPSVDRDRSRRPAQVALLASLCLVALLAAAAAAGPHAAGPKPAKRKPVGAVTWVFGYGVKVAGKEIDPGGTSDYRTKKSVVPLFAGEQVKATGHGIVQFNVHIGNKRAYCRTAPEDGWVQVSPNKGVLLKFIRGVSLCGALPTKGGKTMKLPGATITAQDPVFEVIVKKKQSVVKVRAGAIVVRAKGGKAQAVVVGAGWQTTLFRGRQPGEPTKTQKLTKNESSSLSKLISALPKVRDTTAPKTKILTGPRRSTKSGRATFHFRASETPVTFSCELDGGGFRFCSNPATVLVVTPGRHTFRVRAIDRAGNIGKPAVYPWTVTSTTEVKLGTATQVIARGVTDIHLEVDAHEQALVSYTQGGHVQRVLAWGAINARRPARGGTQVSFHLYYGAPPIQNVCGPYRGPRLTLMVAACTAPDGTNWALQQFARGLPDYGVPPTAEQAEKELRLSHWSGPLAQLYIKTDWAYHGRFRHLYGRLTYRGQPVYGFHSQPLDSFGRNVYVDTFGSAYGPSWRRENSFVTHNPTGVFCYGFYPHPGHPQGTGSLYRATVIGPGVTPDVSWEGPDPGTYNPAADEARNQEQRKLLAGDKLCKIN
jgi:ribosomal protein L27